MAPVEICAWEETWLLVSHYNDLIHSTNAIISYKKFKNFHVYLSVLICEWGGGGGVKRTGTLEKTFVEDMQRRYQLVVKSLNQTICTGVYKLGHPLYN